MFEFLTKGIWPFKKKLVKRTIYEAKCVCGDSQTLVDKPPRERFCRCGRWVPYVEISYTGKEINGKKSCSCNCRS